MARLTAKERAELPNSAFAYVDSRGRRRLPINDESHVRNALARFDQVKFESDAAREKARTRLLKAAKKYGIVPVGFITGQFEAERKHATAGRLVVDLDRVGASEDLEDHLRRVLWDPTLVLLHWSEQEGSYVDNAGASVALASAAEEAVTYLDRDGKPIAALVHTSDLLDDPDLAEAVLAAVRFVIEKEHLADGAKARTTPELPSGFVTLVMTDIEGSTGLLAQLGTQYEQLLTDVRERVRQAVVRHDGHEVEARADEFFAVFNDVVSALEATLEFQLALATDAWPDGQQVRVRAGIHSGTTTLTDEGYIGLAVHTAARLCSAGHGGQILLTAATMTEALDSISHDVKFRSLGRYRLRGLPQAEEIYQVEAKGLPTAFPQLRIGVATPSTEQ